MSTLIQYWQADGPGGETLIREYPAKIMDILQQAIYARPERCVLVMLHDTRGKRDVELWRRPGYSSATGSGPGLLQVWKKDI